VIGDQGAIDVTVSVDRANGSTITRHAGAKRGKPFRITPELLPGVDPVYRLAIRPETEALGPVACVDGARGKANVESDPREPWRALQRERIEENLI
jgi:hypothetical protein